MNDLDPLAVMRDYSAAMQLGLNPPALPDAADLRERFALASQWLTEHGQHGAYLRVLAQRGLAVWCPSWCQADHGPVQIVAEDEPGELHSGRPQRLAGFTAVYQEWHPRDGQPVASVRVVSDQDDGDGLTVPLSALPDLVALLGSVAVPEQ